MADPTRPEPQKIDPTRPGSKIFDPDPSLRTTLLSKLNAVNIPQIKHTWFLFDFLFVTDLSNYNAVIFPGKRCARMEGVQEFNLSMKRESQNKA